MDQPRYLHEVSSEEIISELAKRHDTMIIGLIDPKTKTDLKFDIRVHGDIAWAHLIKDQLGVFLQSMAARAVSSARATIDNEKKDEEESGS